MANQNPNAQRVQKVRKLLLPGWFTNAPVCDEPEEPQKVLVAGLAAKRDIKEYPDTFFGRATKVFSGEFKTLLKAVLWLVPFAIPFILIYAWFSGYFQGLVLGDTYYFMGSIGIGFPGGGDSLQDSVARLIWDVKEPVFLMLAATLIIGAIGLSGSMYCAKRSYFQNYYSKCTKTFFMGVAKHWWKVLLLCFALVLVGAGMGTALIYLLKEQALGTAGAGAYCGVVFSWIFGAAIALVLFVMLTLTTTYKLNPWQTFKNAIVIIVNNPFTCIITAVLSAAPFVIMGLTMTAGSVPIMGIIVIAVMLFAGCNLYELAWTALAHRSMTKCAEKYEESVKVDVQKQRKAAKQSAKGSPAPYVGAGGGSAQKKQKKQSVPYQNPKKKKKKK